MCRINVDSTRVLYDVSRTDLDPGVSGGGVSDVHRFVLETADLLKDGALGAVGQLQHAASGWQLQALDRAADRHIVDGDVTQQLKHSNVTSTIATLHRNFAKQTHTTQLKPSKNVLLQLGATYIPP